MQKYTVILLAGGQPGRFESTRFKTHKALVPIHNKPMLDWTIEAFAQSPRVEHIVVVGPEELDTLASMRYVRKRIFSGINLLQSLIHAVTYVKTILYRSASQHNGYVISFGDLPCLTPEAVTGTLADIESSDADLIGWYSEHTRVQKQGFLKQTAGIQLGGQPCVGAHLYYVRRFTALMTAADAFSQLQDQLHDPQHALQRLGCAGKPLSTTESLLTERFGAKAKLILTENPQWAMAIETEDDLENAQSILAWPWQHPYTSARIIANPTAGRGVVLSPFLRYLLGLRSRKIPDPPTFERAIDEIRTYLAEYGISAEIMMTEKQGDAHRFAQSCVDEQIHLIVVVGGDGTINEVANAIAGSDVTLGVVPFGTANVLGITLRLPMEIKSACQVIASGKRMTIDLGRSNDRYFVCMAGIGFDAQIVQKADSRLKAIWGALAYLFVALGLVLTYRFRRIVLSIDGIPKRKWGYFVVIGNGKYYAGDMMITSKADLTDGKLDVCLFKHRDLFSLLAYYFGMRRGDLDRYLTVEYLQCERMEVKRHGKHAVHVDAEYLGETPVTIEVVPKALKVAV